MADSKNLPPSWHSPEPFDLWRNDFDAAPPAYHSLVGSSQQHAELNDGFASCCAFERLNAITHPSNHHVFHRTPQLRLIGWVVLCRATDDSLSLEQRFSCPLASCDAQFSENEHMQLVNHVSACRHLAEGEYLCPYHGAVENFMSPTAPSHSHRASKRHFLKRTIGKICRLGSRRHSHFGDVKPESNEAELDSRRTQSTTSNKRPRLDQISAPILSRPIVHAPVFSPRSAAPPPPPPPPGPPPAELSADDIPELEGWVGPSLTEPPCLDHYQELPATEHIPQEMEATPVHAPPWDASDNRFSNSSWASASDSVFTSDNTLSPVSPISRDSYFSMDGFDCPVSQVDAPQYAHTPVNNPFRPPPSENTAQVDQMVSLSLGAQAPPPKIPPPVGRKSPRPIPSIRVDTSFNTATAKPMETSPFSSSNSSFDSPISDASDARDSGLFFGQSSAEVKNPRHLVSELRGLFNTLFKVSLRKLCSDPHNATGRRLLSWNASPAVLFERGMRALQNVVNGEMPGDITGIFGMSLLTYACGLADVDFSMPDQFEEIFEEQLRWSCAIEDHAERDLYTALIHQLWAPDDWEARKSFKFGGGCGFGDMSFGSQQQASTMGWDSWNDPLSAMQDPFAGHAWDRPPSAYLNGAAVGLCQRFLDKFEYLLVDLNELNVDVQATPDFGLSLPAEIADPSTMNHEILMANVIRPLASNPALQSFMSVVEKASLLLDTFPNMPLRNTELSLKQEGKDHQASQLLRQAFSAEVQRLANEASNALGCGTGYRAYYHSRDIDKILALHSELLALEGSGAGGERSRSSSLSSTKDRDRDKGKQRAPNQFPSSSSPTSTSKFTYSPTSPTSSQSHFGSLPSTPRRPWSAELDASGSPRISGIFHSRNNSNEEMFRGYYRGGNGRERDNGTVNPTEIFTSHSVPNTSHSTPASRPPSTTTNRPTKPLPRGVRRKKAVKPESAPPTPASIAANAASSSSAATPVAATSAPAASSSASQADKATSSCPICGQRFAGKAQWIRANVTRHVREKHRGTAKRLLCGEPRCKYTSTRRGNVDHHRRTVHGIE